MEMMGMKRKRDRNEKRMFMYVFLYIYIYIYVFDEGTQEMCVPENSRQKETQNVCLL